MSADSEKKKPETPVQKEPAKEESKPIRCFVIMPFSSSDGYENDHFRRVYNHIIVPACKKAGVVPERTDDTFESGYIPTKMFKMLTEYELAICDMSAVNANVFYELGIRQAFDLPVCLIKDEKSRRIFDVQGFASIEYDSSLRIDLVENAVENISKGLKETYEKKNKGEIVNSIKHFLEMKVAEKPIQKEISQDTAVILEKLAEMEKFLSPKRDSNVLVKAPTGAGKTSRAMLMEVERKLFNDFMSTNNFELAAIQLNKILDIASSRNEAILFIRSIGYANAMKLLTFLGDITPQSLPMNFAEFNEMYSLLSSELGKDNIP